MVVIAVAAVKLDDTGDDDDGTVAPKAINHGDEEEYE